MLSNTPVNVLLERSAEQASMQLSDGSFDDTFSERVLTLDYDMPVGDALRKLSHRHVLSAPVIDYSSGMQFKGFLSVTDIVLDFANTQSAEKLSVLHQLGEISEGTVEAIELSETSSLQDWPVHLVSDFLPAQAFMDGYVSKSACCKAPAVISKLEL